MINNLRAAQVERRSLVDERTDDFEGHGSSLLNQAELAKWSRLSHLMSAVHVLLEWSVIVGLIVLCERFWNPLLYVVTVACIGGRQHALGLLMHEAAHYRFSTNRRLNDWLADVFVAWPVLVSTRAYRVNHFAHHRHVNTAADPDLMRKQGAAWVFPTSKWKLAGTLLRDVSGLNTHEQFGFFRRMAGTPGAPQRVAGASPNRRYRLVQFAFYLGGAAVLSWYHAWGLFALYWLIPLFTWLKAILRIRSIAEHFATQNNHPLNISRTTLISPFEKFFIAPKNINFHIEHHLFPSVPFYRLPKLHALLMQNEHYRQQAHVTRGYAGVWRECTALPLLGLHG